MAAKRLLKELDTYRKQPSSALRSLEPRSDGDLFRWTAVLLGPEDTPYQGGQWTIAVEIPSSYPNTPPEMRFETRMCHPNVNFNTGEICLDLLKATWTPAYGIVTTLEAVQQLLSAAGEPDSPLNIDLAKLLRQGDTVGAEGLIRFYTGLYARRS